MMLQQQKRKIKKMIKKFRNFILCFLFFSLIAISGWSIMKIIDLSITIDHQSQEMALMKKKCNIVTILATLAKDEITKSKIDNYLQNSNDQHSYFKKEANQIVIDGVSLYFSGDSLETIEVGLE